MNSVSSSLKPSVFRQSCRVVQWCSREGERERDQKEGNKLIKRLFCSGQMSSDFVGRLEVFDFQIGSANGRYLNRVIRLIVAGSSIDSEIINRLI